MASTNNKEHFEEGCIVKHRSVIDKEPEMQTLKEIVTIRLIAYLNKERPPP